MSSPQLSSLPKVAVKRRPPPQRPPIHFAKRAARDGVVTLFQRCGSAQRTSSKREMISRDRSIVAWLSCISCNKRRCSCFAISISAAERLNCTTLSPSLIPTPLTPLSLVTPCSGVGSLRRRAVSPYGQHVPGSVTRNGKRDCVQLCRGSDWSSSTLYNVKKVRNL
jgi:hypothetical protein